jgi:hypothetical protein
MCGVGITFVEDNQGALYVKSLVPGGSSARSGNVQVLHERQKPASQHAGRHRGCRVRAGQRAWTPGACTSCVSMLFLHTHTQSRNLMQVGDVLVEVNRNNVYCINPEQVPIYMFARLPVLSTRTQQSLTP